MNTEDWEELTKDQASQILKSDRGENLIGFRNSAAVANTKEESRAGQILIRKPRRGVDQGRRSKRAQITAAIPWEEAEKKG